jgi:hypothetical protein
MREQGTRRIGEELDYSNRTSLYDWVSNGGYGMSGISKPQELPREMYQFMVEQYRRFGVPVPPENVLLEAAWAMFFTVDYIDPYALLFGLTDVEASDEWALHTYDIKMYDGRVEEADPEQLETFTYTPGMDHINFNHIMSNPGLDYIGLGSAGEMINEYLGGDAYCDDDAYSRLEDPDKEWIDARSPQYVDPPPKPVLTSMIHVPVSDQPYRIETELEEPNLYYYQKYKSGVRYKGMEDFDRPDVKAHFEALLQNRRAHETRLDYFRLGSWAALAWLVSPFPEAKEFREQCWDYFYMAYKHGECVLYAGTFLKHEDYTKLQRPSKSCVVCNLASWCVEYTYINGTNRLLCEQHLNGELPKIAPVTCGTKVCKFAECPHHPYHGMENGRGLAYRNSGMLNTMVTNNAPHLAYASEKQKLLC